jgi:alpha-ribazole phosphatase
MTRLLLVRHGSTAWNAQSRYQGRSDISLNEDGREQVKLLAERLRTEEIDAFYASDLRRAWETAEAIAAHHDLPIHAAPRLQEIGFGAWEGKTHEQIKEDDPESLDRWYDDPIHASPPGGETLKEVTRRVEAAYQGVMDRHPEETVLIAAHGGTLRVLLCLALGVPPQKYWQFRFDVASLSELNTYDKGTVLSALNDTSHLRRLGGPSRQSRESSNEQNPGGKG